MQSHTQVHGKFSNQRKKTVNNICKTLFSKSYISVSKKPYAKHKE